MQKTDTKKFGYILASKSDRLIAKLLEGLIYIIAFTGLCFLFGQFSWDRFSTYYDYNFKSLVYGGIFGLTAGAVWYPLFKGNLGHRILKLKVISEVTGDDYKSTEAGAMREFLKSILGFLIIPAIWILWDKNNQNLYDKLTRTYVVKCKTPKNS